MNFSRRKLLGTAAAGLVSSTAGCTSPLTSDDVGLVYVSVLNMHEGSVDVIVTIRAAESEPVAETITLESNQHSQDANDTSPPPYQAYIPPIWEEEAAYFEVTGELSGVNEQFSTAGEATEESNYIGLHGHVLPGGDSLIWSIERIAPEDVPEYQAATERLTANSSD